MKWHCPICGEPTDRPLEAAWWHFRLIQSPKVWRGYLSGTYTNFGLISVLCLVSPILSTIVNWKHRKDRLHFYGEGPKE